MLQSRTAGALSAHHGYRLWRGARALVAMRCPAAPTALCRHCATTVTPSAVRGGRDEDGRTNKAGDDVQRGGHDGKVDGDDDFPVPYDDAIDVPRVASADGGFDVDSMFALDDVNAGAAGGAGAATFTSGPAERGVEAIVADDDEEVVVAAAAPSGATLDAEKETTDAGESRIEGDDATIHDVADEMAAISELLVQASKSVLDDATRANQARLEEDDATGASSTLSDAADDIPSAAAPGLDVLDVVEDPLAPAADVNGDGELVADRAAGEDHMGIDGDDADQDDAGDEATRVHSTEEVEEHEHVTTTTTSTATVDHTRANVVLSHETATEAASVFGHLESPLEGSYIIPRKDPTVSSDTTEEKKQYVRALLEAQKFSPGVPQPPLQQRRQAQNETAARLSAALPSLQQVGYSDLARLSEVAKAREWLDTAVEGVWANTIPAGNFVHIDFDMFYASVHLKRDRTLQEGPFVVVNRTAIACADYKARQYGVRSGMPVSVAREVCPNLRIVPSDMPLYREKSEELIRVLRKYDPNPVAVGLDEATLDVSDLLDTINAGFAAVARSIFDKHGLEAHDGALGGVPQIARADLARVIWIDVMKSTGLSCSVGSAPTHALAKLAAGRNKPHGVFDLPTDREVITEFMSQLPVASIKGIGPKSLGMLDAFNVETVQDVREQFNYLATGLIPWKVVKHLGLAVHGAQPPLTNEAVPEAAFGQVRAAVEAATERSTSGKRQRALAAIAHQQQQQQTSRRRTASSAQQERADSESTAKASSSSSSTSRKATTSRQRRATTTATSKRSTTSKPAAARRRQPSAAGITTSADSSSVAPFDVDAVLRGVFGPVPLEPIGDGDLSDLVARVTAEYGVSSSSSSSKDKDTTQREVPDEAAKAPLDVSALDAVIDQAIGDIRPSDAADTTKEDVVPSGSNTTAEVEDADAAGLRVARIEDATDEPHDAVDEADGPCDDDATPTETPGTVDVDAEVASAEEVPSDKDVADEALLSDVDIANDPPSAGVGESDVAALEDVSPDAAADEAIEEVVLSDETVTSSVTTTTTTTTTATTTANHTEDVVNVENADDAIGALHVVIQHEPLTYQPVTVRAKKQLHGGLAGDARLACAQRAFENAFRELVNSPFACSRVTLEIHLDISADGGVIAHSASVELREHTRDFATIEAAMHAAATRLPELAAPSPLEGSLEVAVDFAGLRPSA